MIKKYIFPAIFLLGILSAGILPAQARHAENPPETGPNRDCKTPPPHAPNMKKVSKRELQMLKTLFLMSDKELARMRELITKLERTPEAKRRKMAEDLERATSDDPSVQQKFMDEMRRRFETRRKNLLERYYATLPEKQAKAEAEAFLKMSRREKFEYMNAIRAKLGMPPPRKPGDKKQEPSPPPKQ